MLRTALFLLLLSLSASAERLAELSWLAGDWGDSQTQEHWSEPKGSTMLGYNRSKDFHEFLKIVETEGGVTYWASPQSGTWVPFKMKELTSTKVRFVNPDHDFPQEIIYQLRGKTLLVTISDGADESRAWTFTKL